MQNAAEILRTVKLRDRKGEIVAELEIEGGTASKGEIEAHYTQFAKMFMRHLGHGLKAELV